MSTVIACAEHMTAAESFAVAVIGATGIAAIAFMVWLVAQGRRRP